MTTTDPRPHTGRLMRQHDVSGVSGVGHVADVVIWSDGTGVTRWLGDYPTTVHHDHGRASVDHIHSHGGATRIVWDNPWHTPPDLRIVQAHVEDALQGEIEHWDDGPMREALWTVLGHVQPLVSEVASLREKLATAERDRDLAIAHDRQPYPTADAYERACAALEKHRARADAAEAERDALREALAIRKEMHEDTRTTLTAELRAARAAALSNAQERDDLLEQFDQRGAR